MNTTVKNLAAAGIALAGLAGLMPSATATAQNTVDPSAYTLRDEAIYMGEDLVSDAPVNNVDAGSVKSWVVVIEDDANGPASVFFFGEEGQFMGILPIEYASECKDIVFRPDGAFFVLVGGSEIRRDVIFNVYRLDGMEKMAELAGFRDDVTWVDGVRFVFTRIDGIRPYDESDGAGGAYEWRVSVVMYDTAIAEEIVLKEATDKQNFWTDIVYADENYMNVREEYVKSKKDWGNEDKKKTRILKVEIPAAG
jgi:hypothetical protein